MNISFDYEMQITLSAPADDNWAFGITSVDAGLIPLTGDGGGVRNVFYVETVLGPGGSFGQTWNGTVTLSGDFLAEQQVGFVVDALAGAQGTTSYLSAPASALLLLPGLALLGWVRRRRE